MYVYASKRGNARMHMVLSFFFLYREAACLPGGTLSTDLVNISIANTYTTPILSFDIYMDKYIYIERKKKRKKWKSVWGDGEMF